MDLEQLSGDGGRNEGAQLVGHRLDSRPVRPMGLAQETYRAFVAEGRGGPRPWERLTGQIYLGSEEFVAQHQPNRVIRDIPGRQT